MNTSKLTRIIKNVRTAARKHSPEILTGIGIAGMITTTVMAVRATPKALFLIEEAEDEKGVMQYEEGKDPNSFTLLTPIEMIKVAGPCYIPAAVVGAISIGCLIGASSVNMRRNAALATAYALSESTLKEYQEKVIEEIGEKKEREVRDAISKDHVEKNPVSKSEVIITEKGNTLCFDKLSGRYFRSDIERLRKAENELNRRMRDDMYISLNEFYWEIGLDSIKIGEDIGWNIDTGYIDIDFSSQLADDGTPCLVVDYSVAPRYEYR